MRLHGVVYLIKHRENFTFTLYIMIFSCIVMTPYEHVLLYLDRLSY